MDEPPGAEARPLRLILADDEALARQRLKTLLADLAAALPTQVLAEADNGAAALAAAREHPADAILLDIQMPDLDGLDAARRLAQLPHPPAIIFVTAHEEHALRAFDLRAVDYLLKPVRLTRLHEALSRVAQRLTSPPAERASAAPRRHLNAQEPGRVWQVALDDVLYLRAEQGYVTARTRQREFVLDESLVRLEDEFPEHFLRIHRNCLVALHQLAGFRRVLDAEGGHWCAVLRDWPETLPVSRRQAHVVRAFRSSAGKPAG